MKRVLAAAFICSLLITNCSRQYIGGSGADVSPLSGGTIVTSGTGGGGNCTSSNPGVWALAGSGNSLALSNSAAVLVSNDIVINSSAAAAVTITNGAALSANLIFVDGGDSIDSSSSVSTTDSTLHTGFGPASDPFGSLPNPDPSSLTIQSSAQLIVNGGVVTLDPGVYVGGIVMMGGAFVTMNPGVYFLEGGLTISDLGTVVLGDGVLIFDSTGGNNFVNGAIIELNPPATGTYAGISIFQDRGDNSALQISGNPIVLLGGSIYEAGATLSVADSSAISFNGVAVVQGMQVSNSNVSISGNLSMIQICPSNPCPGSVTMSVARKNSSLFTSLGAENFPIVLNSLLNQAHGIVKGAGWGDVIYQVCAPSGCFKVTGDSMENGAILPKLDSLFPGCTFSKQ